MIQERLFSYVEPGGERGEVYEWITVTEAEIRAHWLDHMAITKEKVSFDHYLTRWLAERYAYEITDSYPYAEEEENDDTRGHA
jgi:hypothetical protein